MATTISDGTTTIHPEQVLGYESARPGGNLVHTILDGSIAVSLRPAGLRTGTLELLFPLEADAAAAEELHRTAASFTLTEPDRPTIAMSYVLADGGELGRALDDETRDHWVVSVDFQEVLP